jgi:hypothetical protein
MHRYIPVSIHVRARFVVARSFWKCTPATRTALTTVNVVMAVVLTVMVVVLRRLGHRSDVLVDAWFWRQSGAEPEDERRAYTLK